jgi:hypothetical protein
MHHVNGRSKSLMLLLLFKVFGFCFFFLAINKLIFVDNLVILRKCRGFKIELVKEFYDYIFQS